MKKLLLPLLLFVLVGCEKTDMFGIKYSDYPIAGKAYITKDYTDWYNIYRFYENGECDAESYSNGKHIDTIDDYRYFMEGDSIFISIDSNPKYKFLQGCYNNEYNITISGTEYVLCK